MTEKELNDAKDRVVAETIGQTVFKHLERIENNRTLLSARWIWELLQNARDVARGKGVRIEMRVSAKEFRFAHDGKPFTSDEIAHLVYHGSTKFQDDQYIGQFGSGFLTTHLLSRKIRVAGRLDDLKAFTFLLDRTGRTVEELGCAMNRSWDSFVQSVKPAQPGAGPNTSFAYQFTPPGRGLAEAGLEELRRCGPLVLAFCPEITSIHVGTSDARWSLTRGNRSADGELLIQYAEAGEDLARYVAVAEGEGECCAALQLRPSESGLQIDQGYETTAKLFVVFPLIGSEGLGLPATVNSKRFKPHEDRNGIFLTGDSEGVRKNKQLLLESVRHQEQILDWCAQRKWTKAHQVLGFDTAHHPDWVDGDAFFRGLLTQLVRKARATPLMPTLGGDWIQPQASWVPTTEDPAHSTELWTLMSLWSEAQQRLPCCEELDSWSKNLTNWAKLLDKPREEMDEALTIEKVAQLVSDAESVEGLQQLLTSRESLSWLLSFFELVCDSGKTGILDKHKLLPTQAGGLRTRKGLFRDQGISDELKDIAEAFGLEFRNELLDRQAEMDVLTQLLEPRQEREVLDKLLAHVKEECRDGTIKVLLAPAAVRLFNWIAVHPDYLELLEGYPVPTAGEGDDVLAVLCLERGRDAPEKPLAPLAIWPEGARRFGSLFPKGKVLAEAFVDQTEPEVWDRLVASGYLNASPLIETKRVVEAFLPDEPPEGIHKSTLEVEVSDVACLQESDIGLIDTARKSRRRAKEFVRFLIEYVAESDERAFHKFGVDCECGDCHKTYRAAWLTPLRHRRWVPIDASSGRAETASAESLAELLADSPETQELLSRARGKELLDALGIRPSDLALRAVAVDEDQRLMLIRSMHDLAEVAGDVDRLRQLATEICEHPEIIDSIEEQKKDRQKVRRNQEIGRRVEQLLQQELEGCGLTVRRTGIGSDFEVESDFVENDEEIWLELEGTPGSTFIEVKSTKGDIVKMTPVQAKQACSLGDRFALCVVPLNDDAPTSEMIREGLRVVFGIGAHLQTAVSDYESLQEAADTARKPRGEIELEITEGEARFRIGRAIWEDALPFEMAVQRFRGADGLMA